MNDWLMPPPSTFLKERMKNIPVRWNECDQLRKKVNILFSNLKYLIQFLFDKAKSTILPRALELSAWSTLKVQPLNTLSIDRRSILPGNEN